MPDRNVTLDQIAKQWSNKTLGLLYSEAAAEETGIAFDAMKTPDGKRQMIVICATTPEVIAAVEKAINLGEDIPPAIWDDLLISEFLMRCEGSGGLTYEDMKGTDGRREALAFAAVGPEGVRIVETLFGLQN